MDFNFSEEQEMLRKFARDFLNAECPTSLVKELEQRGGERGYPEELWHKIADLGWIGLPFPEQYGGGGGSFFDLALLLEEMGRACFPGPYFSSVVLGGTAIMEGGSEQQKKELLPKMADGSCIFTLAFTEASAKYSPDSITAEATKQEGCYVLKGRKLFVPDANVADQIIFAAKAGEGDITLFLVDAKSQGIRFTPLRTMVGDKQFEVVFDKVEVPQAAILGGVNRGGEILGKVLERATVAKCAEMVGGAQRVLEMSADYVKTRVQFDRPIGSFQAIQHHLANMLIDVMGARWITYQACWMLSENLPCKLEVSAAKAWTSEAYRRVTALGQQVHGGVAFIITHDMPLYFKRAKQWEPLFGDADFHREMVAKQLGM